MRFAGKAGLSDGALRLAIKDAERELVDAELGGGVIKQRVARPGGGKSGGFRAVVLFRSGERAFFVHGFAKSDLGNIQPDELAAFKLLASQMLVLSEPAIDAALKAGALIEVGYDD